MTVWWVSSVVAVWGSVSLVVGVYLGSAIRTAEAAARADGVL
ncbi:MAG: hypothetical protein WBA00_15660 [Rhodococcus sp. (in: high G+C Gram-positive bacteria)]